MIRLFSLILASCLFLSSCVAMQTTMLKVGNITFPIDESDIEVLTMDGASIWVGKGDTGYSIVRDDPSTLLAGLPEKLGLTNSQFMESLINRESSARNFDKYRVAFGIYQKTTIETVRKGRWLVVFIANAEGEDNVGDRAYLVTDTNDMVYMIVNESGISQIKSLIDKSVF